MPLFEIRAGGPEIADGVYPVVLTKIEGPKTVTAQRGPKAGQDIDLFDWTFAVDAPGSVEDGVEITASTSTASGPKSKMYAWLTALFGGRAPAVGTSFETDQLMGRAALATIRKDESGWPRLENLGAMPAAMLGARVAQVTGAPTNQAVPANAPVRSIVDQASEGQFVGAPAQQPMATPDDLPF
jgi:hypothetical protein